MYIILNFIFGIQYTFTGVNCRYTICKNDGSCTVYMSALAGGKYGKQICGGYYHDGFICVGHFNDGMCLEWSKSVDVGLLDLRVVEILISRISATFFRLISLCQLIQDIDIFGGKS